MSTEDEIRARVSEAPEYELELVWIPKIMDRQTPDEVQAESTIEVNKKGLSAFDASIITSLYHQIQGGKHLTAKQGNAARKILPKYARQYVQISRT